MIYPNIKNPTRRSASRKRRTGFFEFDSEDLRDTGRIMELFDHLTQKRRHPIAGSQEERLSIMCCAEHALRIGKKPIKLFLWMIGKWPESLQNIADMDEDSAHRRLKTWEEFRRGRESPDFVRQLLSKIVSPEEPEKIRRLIRGRNGEISVPE